MPQWSYPRIVLPATITTEKVWRAVEKHFFAVLSFVTSRGEARSAGIVYTVRDWNIYIITETNTWKGQAYYRKPPRLDDGHDPEKRVTFMPWIPIPPATITFQGDASIHDVKEVPPEIIARLLCGLKLNDEDRAALCIIRIRPWGSSSRTASASRCRRCANRKRQAAASRYETMTSIFHGLRLQPLAPKETSISSADAWIAATALVPQGEAVTGKLLLRCTSRRCALRI
jgi:hypothetical protein